MEFPTKRSLGGGLLLTAGVVLGREFIFWGFGKALDAGAALVRSALKGMTMPSNVPWGDAFSLLLMILGGWLLISGKRKTAKIKHQSDSLKEDLEKPDRFPDDLYVGETYVDASHLSDEYYLEIAILDFNAAGVSISIGESSGAIAVCESSGDSSTARIDLPPATVMHDRTPTHDIGDLNQFLVVLHQRIPRSIAEHFLTAIDGGGQINLYFNSLNLMVRASSDPANSTRLPIWAGACLRKVPERILTDKIVVGSASIVIGAPSD